MHASRARPNWLISYRTFEGGWQVQVSSPTWGIHSATSIHQTLQHLRMPWSKSSHSLTYRWASFRDFVELTGTEIIMLQQ